MIKKIGRVDQIHCLV